MAGVEGAGSRPSSVGGRPAGRSPSPPPADEPRSRAPTPAPSSREGSAHYRNGSTFTIRADGSSHGGRRFFDSPTVGAPPALSDEQRRQQGKAEEYALELHSLQPGVQHPAPLRPTGPDGHHDTAGQAALRQLAAGRAAHGSNGGGGGKGDFGDAVVMIEEADDRQLFDWGTYFSSLPKKLKVEGS